MHKARTGNTILRNGCAQGTHLQLKQPSDLGSPALDYKAQVWI